eukprot:2829773-Ditylum_brightwellii.AAC.1
MKAIVPEPVTLPSIPLDRCPNSAVVLTVDEGEYALFWAVLESVKVLLLWDHTVAVPRDFLAWESHALVEYLVTTCSFGIADTAPAPSDVK